MDNKLVEYLKASSTIITPSRRLAGSLLTQTNSYLGKTQGVWSTPSFFALADWLQAIWQQLEIQGFLKQQLLQPSQALLAWTAVIRSFAISHQLLNANMTATIAMQAWGILHDWLVVDTWYETPLSLDQETFKEFANAYQEWLNTHHAIDSAQLLSCIQPYFSTAYQVAWQRVSPVKQLVFYGFEEISPSLEQLVESLTANQWKIDFIDPAEKIPTKIGRVDLHDQEQELLSAIQFAKNRMQAGKKNIGIVIPDLANQRKWVDKTLKEIFDPLALCEPQAKVCADYNISAAVPLDHYPIIHSAFSLLKMIKGKFSLNDYFNIINAPCFAWDANALSGILQHYEQLKRNNLKTLSLAKLSQSLTEPTLREIILKLMAFKEITAKQSYAKWTQTFQSLLAIAGWPGVNALNSVEHQAVSRFYMALDELRLNDSVLGPATFTEALSNLRAIVSRIPFQAQSKGASVQVLGVLEALGLQFDCLWIVGLHSEAWPPLAKPNPFIPLPLQRQLKMPHASSEREMNYAKTMTHRLLASADEVIVSYPKNDKAKTLEMSELIRHIPILPEAFIAPFIQAERLEHRFTTPLSLEKIAATEMLPLQPTEKIAVTSHLLTLQSACPFKAFAEIRLHAKRIEMEDDWLAPHQQGIILHEILQHFWHQLKTQVALIALNEDELTAKLLSLIDSALQKHIKENTPQPYLKVEKSRLLLILQDYLALEKARQPFQVVATETVKSYTLSGMQFRLRLDRVDQTTEGEMLLIDYKTGQFNVADIWGDRPKAPQLPLYYLSAIDDAPQAIIVAKLNRQDLAYEGIAHHDLQMPGVSVPKYYQWDELQSYWSEKLNTLVISFQQGNTAVDPLDVNTTCRYCDLGPFCRINSNWKE